MKEKRFRLGTTSFIYPDHIIPNVRKIGPFFDEIELLVFESRPAHVLPSKADIRELKVLGRDLDLTYNIHLPVDISLTHEGAGERQTAADTLKKVVEGFAPLAPTSFTLHLDMDKPGPGQDRQDSDAIKKWEDRARHGLGLLVPGIDDPGRICVETLWYPPSVFAPLIREYELSVCGDLGHHMKYGYDMSETFEIFTDRIPLIHVHGVDMDLTPPKDHLGLDRLPGAQFDQVANILERFTGTISLEVFSLASLKGSLERLNTRFNDIPVIF